MACRRLADGRRPGAGDRRAATGRSSSTATAAVDGVRAVAVDGPADHTVVLARRRPRHRAVVNVQPHEIDVVHRGQRFVFERPDVFGDHGPAAGDGTLVAPMPGTVLSVDVEAGQAVAEGDTLGVMEAMKMELALKAPFAGTVTEVNAKTGDQVALGFTLFVVEPSVVEPSVEEAQA